MSSSGGLTSLDQAKKVPIRLVESGPAGGIIFASSVSRELKEENSIAIDIGGTTAKVCYLHHGEPLITRRLEIARSWKNKSGSGLPLRIPAMNLVEIGAGGGSIAKTDILGRLVVGPESANSNPGPACYNLGGENPTVTDANLVIGRISKNSFAGGFINLVGSKAKISIQNQIVEKLKFKSAEWAAAGIVEISEDLMANAVRIHGIELGKNIKDFCLIVSGGGGPIHAVGIANKLDITRIIVPHLAGVGSALGFLSAPISYEIAQSISKFITDLKPNKIKTTIEEIKGNIKKILSGVTTENKDIEFKVEAELRYQGQGHEISIPIENYLGSVSYFDDLTQQFIFKYKTKFGFSMPDISIEIVSLIISAKCSNSIQRPTNIMEPKSPSSKRANKSTEVFDITTSKFLTYKVFERENLPEGFFEKGPCLIQEEQTTTVVPKDWNVSKHIKNHLILTKK